MFDIIVGMNKKLPTESKLSKKKLHFETTKKTISASKKYIKEQISKKCKHIDVKSLISSKFTKIKTSLANVVKKVKHPSKTSKKMTKTDRELVKKQRNRVIMGICQLLVVVSIVYSTYITYTFVGSIVSVIILVPQALFALCISVKAFSQLYK